MIKTIIIQLEDVILSQDILRFKIYEILWYYLRHDPYFETFAEILKLREFYLTESGAENPYSLISQRYLPPRERERFEKDIQVFIRRMSAWYLRLIPGMMTVVRNLKYYYKLVLVMQPGRIPDLALRKFALEKRFNYIIPAVLPVRDKERLPPIQLALQKTRTGENEAVFIHALPYSRHLAANTRHIFCIYAGFDPRIRGFVPGNLREREFVESLSRVPEPRQSPPKYQTGWVVASTPHEILGLVANIEKGEAPEGSGSRLEAIGTGSIMDQMREILIPSDETG